MATRGMSITYGDLKVGGNSAIQLDGFTNHAVQDGTAESHVEFQAVVTGVTIAEFSARCRSIEEALRKPRQTLVVEQEGHVMICADHDSAVGGFNTEPEIRKIGDVGDTGRSRRYTIRVRYETPADTVTTRGLRESIVDVSYSESRIRTITISGTFTAVEETTSARARYEAAIDAHTAAALTALGVTTSELIGEPQTEQDYDDKTIRFQRVYEELVFGQGQDAPNDDASIVKQVLTVSRREFSEERSPLSQSTNSPTTGGAVGPGGQQAASATGGNVQALAVFDLHYEASIDATITTDLLAKYNSLRSWLVGQFSSAFSQGAFALTQDRPQFNRIGNRLVVDMTAEGAVRGVDYVRRTVNTARKTDTPKVFRGVWNGDPLAAYIYEGFELTLRTVTVVTRFLATKDATQAEEANDAAARSVGGGGGGGGIWHVIQTDTNSTPVRIGIEGSGHVLNMTDVTSVVVSRKANAVGGGGGMGGGGEVSRPGGLSGGILTGVGPNTQSLGR